MSNPPEKPCPHRRNKNLIVSFDLRPIPGSGKFKKHCDDCPDGGHEKKIFLCTAARCLQYKCGCFESHHLDCHMHQHAGSTGHAIFYNSKDKRLWCDYCCVELLPDNSPKDPVVLFLDSVPNSKKKVKEETVELGTELPAENDTAIRSPSLATADDECNAKADKHGFQHVVALRNLGNTCYYNSGIQCLMHIFLMHKYLETVNSQPAWTAPVRFHFKMFGRESFVLPRHEFKYPADRYLGSVLSALDKFLEQYREGTPIDHQLLLDAICNSYHRPVLPRSVQCDASEFFMLLTECMESEERKLWKLAVEEDPFSNFHKQFPLEHAVTAYQQTAGSPDVATSIDAVFGLVYLQSITCEMDSCKHTSRTPMTTSQLNLHLGYQPSTHILNCLQNWTEGNKLKEYKCANCCSDNPKHRVDATQKFAIYAPPPVLVLCLERAGTGTQKLQTRVLFDLLLDIKPFCSKYGVVSVISVEKQSMISLISRYSEQQNGLSYGLYGIVIHKGVHSSNVHFVACVRMRRQPSNIISRFKEALSSPPINKQAVHLRIRDLMNEARSQPTETQTSSVHSSDRPCEEDQWYMISDEDIHPVSWSDVSSEQAYMLFYERLD